MHCGIKPSPSSFVIELSLFYRKVIITIFLKRFLSYSGKPFIFNLDKHSNIVAFSKKVALIELL